MRDSMSSRAADGTEEEMRGHNFTPAPFPLQLFQEQTGNVWHLVGGGGDGSTHRNKAERERERETQREREKGLNCMTRPVISSSLTHSVWMITRENNFMIK